MNKLAILKVAVCVGAAVLLAGCQSGRSDQKLIACTMSDWQTAVEAKDVDKIMEAYSENYTSERGSGKDGVRQFMTRAFERGFMENTKVKLDEAEAAIDGDKATFGPVKFVSDRGEFVLEYSLAKEDEAWRIVGTKRVQQ